MPAAPRTLVRSLLAVPLDERGRYAGGVAGGWRGIWRPAAAGR